MKEKEFKDEILVATNKKAKFNYFLSDFLECGIVLEGSEIKSLRKSRCSIDDSYCIHDKNEIYILNMNIPQYQSNNKTFTHEELRTRKLLLHKRQILELRSKTECEGYTLIPTRIYIKRGICKVQIALGKGKKNYDKREVIKKRDIDRKLNRLAKERYR